MCLEHAKILTQWDTLLLFFLLLLLLVSPSGTPISPGVTGLLVMGTLHPPHPPIHLSDAPRFCHLRLVQEGLQVTGNLVEPFLYPALCDFMHGALLLGSKVSKRASCGEKLVPLVSPVIGRQGIESSIPN